MSSKNNNSQDIQKFMKPGMKVSVTLEFGPTDKLIIHTHYIGCKDEQYLIIELPIKILEDLSMRQLANVDTVIRGISDTELGHIIAFKTSVINTITKPFPLLFLRAPKQFATKAVREHQRYKLSLPVTVSYQSNVFEGTILDFSVSGCGLLLETRNELVCDTEINVESQLKRFLPSDIKYCIVSVKRHQKGQLVGIKFNNPIIMGDDLKQEILEQAFIAGSI